MENASADEMERFEADGPAENGCPTLAAALDRFAVAHWLTEANDGSGDESQCCLTGVGA